MVEIRGYLNGGEAMVAFFYYGTAESGAESDSTIRIGGNPALLQRIKAAVPFLTTTTYCWSIREDLLKVKRELRLDGKIVVHSTRPDFDPAMLANDVISPPE